MADEIINTGRFEGIVRHLYWHVFHAGIDSLKQEGLIRSDSELFGTIENSASAFRRFIRGCHYGFDVAQKGIGRLVCECELEVRRLTRELKAARRQRDKNSEGNILMEINALRYQELLIRRLADSILAHLVLTRALDAPKDADRACLHHIRVPECAKSRP